MMNRRRFLSASALAATGCALPAALAAAPAHSEDIRLLGEILRTLHPGLHRYLSPQAFEAGLARLNRQWQIAPGLEAQFLSLTGFLATIRCGHTYPSFYNQKQAVSEQMFARKDRLPFAFRWIGGQMVVTQSQSADAKLPKGSVIKAINGIPAAKILARLIPYVRSDGSNDGKRTALLSCSGTDAIETFDILYGMVFGPPPGGLFNLRYRAPGLAREMTASVPAIDLAARKASQRKPDRSGDAPVWQWAMAAEGIVTLTMPSWGLYDSKWNWRSWLGDRLDSLKGAKGLIVDLRENEGGEDCGDMILARMAGREIALPRERRLVRYRQVPAALNPYLDTWDDSFRDWGGDVQPYDERFLRLTRWEDDTAIRPIGPALGVPMAVLTSPQNSSATFRFASLVKAARLGTLVGGTTGGNRRGINGGAFFFARLPESGLEFDVPLVGYFPDKPQPDAGLTPDLAVANTAADIAGGYDREMAAARSLLSRG